MSDAEYRRINNIVSRTDLHKCKLCLSTAETADELEEAIKNYRSANV